MDEQAQAVLDDALAVLTETYAGPRTVTPQLVAIRLSNRSIKGRPGTAYDCPVSVYIRQRLADAGFNTNLAIAGQPAVLVRVFAYSGAMVTRDGEVLAGAKLHPAVKQFIQTFDALRTYNSLLA